MISPIEAVRPNADDHAEAKKHEAYIDGRLSNYDGPETVTVNCSKRAAQVLQKTYQDGGWIVALSSSPDQRDPGWSLTFSIPAPPRSYK
jgi:hypothetical protein